MAGFNAATVVEALDYAFDSCKGNHEGSCWRGPETGPRPAKCTVFVPGCHGVVPEPTDDQIVRFLTDVKALVGRLHEKAEADVDGRDPAGLVDAIEELDPSVVGEFHQELAGIFEGLCSGEPSREQVLGVPMRIRVMFYGWLRQEVMNPEAAPGGGNAQVTTLRSAAAG
jgi:hypothetical protein